MLTLDDHDDSTRRQGVLESVGDLTGQPLLHLRQLRVQIHQPCDFRQAGDLALHVRQIANVSNAVEWQHVVLAGAVDLDVFDHDDLVVVRVENRRQHLFGPLLQPSKLFGHGASDPLRRALKTIARGIFADGQQDLAHGRFDAIEVDRPYLDAIVVDRRPFRPVGYVARHRRQSWCAAEPSALTSPSGSLSALIAPEPPLLTAPLVACTPSPLASTASSRGVMTGALSDGCRLP